MEKTPIQFGEVRATGAAPAPAQGAPALAGLGVGARVDEPVFGRTAPAGQGHLGVAAEPAATPLDWRRALPVLGGRRGFVRDLRVSDAASLLAMLTPIEVARFISPPPATLEGFERFIAWSHRRRDEGTCLGFAIVPQGLSDAVGLIQVRQLEPSWSTAEWGFALGSAFWGTGLFVEAARLVVDFVFQTVGVHRLEARASVRNGRGNGALAKLGAVREGVLRRAFFRDGQYSDQILWSILREEWMQSKAVWNDRVH